MKDDEIKEILDYLKNDDYCPAFADEGCDDTPYKLLDEEETKLLLDYINNLQQENERLKEKSINEVLKNDFDMCVKDLKKANKKIEKLEDYKSRCEKANWWLKEMLKQAKSDETKAIINGALDLLLNSRNDE